MKRETQLGKPQHNRMTPHVDEDKDEQKQQNISG